MMSKDKDEQLFKTLRELSPEMSEEEVGEMLTAFPTQVIAKHWFYRYHLNSILLIVGMLGLLAGSYFLLPKQELAISKIVSVESVTIENAFDSTQEKIDDSTKEISTSKSSIITEEKLKNNKKHKPIAQPSISKIASIKKEKILEKQPIISIRSELEKVLQKSLDSNHLERILEKEANGDFRPLTLVTNHHFFKKVDLNLAGEKVNVVYSKDTTDIHEAFIGITQLDIEKEKATLSFQYKGALVVVSLTKKNEEWIYRSIQIKDQFLGEIQNPNNFNKASLQQKI